MTHERLQQLLAWIDEIHWEGDDRTKVDELVSYIDNSTSAPHRRASLGDRIKELENLWADESKRAGKAEARVKALETERDEWKTACLRARDAEEALLGVGPLTTFAEQVARAEKAEAKVAKLEATIDDIYNGEHGWECTDCGRPTANGKCTECRRGISPWKKLEAERDALRARVERVRTMAEEAGSKTYLDPWDVLDVLEGK